MTDKCKEEVRNYIIAILGVSSLFMLLISSSLYEFGDSGEIYNFELSAHNFESRVYVNDFNLHMILQQKMVL